MRIRILVNEGGGTVRRNGGMAEQRALIDDAFARYAGIRRDIVFSNGDELAASATYAPAVGRHELDAIVVGGGDGSVGTVAGVLAATGVALGIIPLGTLNHFAKDVGIPTDLAGAVAVIAANARRIVDVAEVNGRVFVNNSSIGLYPRMVLDRDRQAMRGCGKGLATLLAGLNELRRFPRRRLRVVIAGRDSYVRSPCLFVGNNEYDIDLLTLGTRRRLDAGELCVYVARPRHPLGLVWLALRAAFGGIEAVRDLDLVMLKAVEVGSRAGRLLVAHDGEVAVMRPPLRYRSRAGELVVLAPPPVSPPPA